MDMSVYLTAPLQLEKICRACLTEKGDMRPLFGACLDEMLHSFASIEVSEGDGFPNLMCVQCVLQCSRAYTFKQQCEKSDNILRQYLSPEFQQQLAQSIADQEHGKSELQEQLQFADQIDNVVIEEDISEYVTYNEDDQLDVKESIYTIESAEQENCIDDSIKLESIQEEEQNKLKYPCSKCEMSFSLKVDLKAIKMESDEDMAIYGTPPEVVEAANMVMLNLLPEKSRKKYELTYNRFMDYCHKTHTTSRSENVVIAYFSELSTKMKAATLWSSYSMLKATLNANENIDISKYQKLRAFLRRQSEGYKAKKSKVLSGEQMQQFIAEAPDDIYLITKVALIFGVSGACRRDELYKLRLQDIEDLGSKLLISILDNKTKKPRSFVVNEKYMELYRKYSALRPKNFENARFFFKYLNGKGFNKVVGIHQFGKMPQIVAKFLNLPNPEEFTGHCFRQSSATILVDAGADFTSLKRHGAWKSASVADGYVEESLDNKIEVANMILKMESEKKTFKY